MGLARRILSSFKPKNEEKEEKATHFLQNGGELLAELIAFSNGRYDIPIRSFAAKELVKATNNFSESVFTKNETVLFIGHLDGRQILVNKWTGGRNFRRNEAICDLVISSHMNHHKNALKLIGCCLELALPASVYEYAGSILLSDLLDSGSDNRLLSWRSRLKIASDISSSILYLHTAFSTPVIYRNIKPSKVIIDQNGVAKLFDFTLAISLPPGEMSVETDVAGTLGYLDPEYIQSGFVTQKSDVYSFGMFLLVLLTGKSVFWEDHEGESVHLIKHVTHYANNHQYDEFIDPEILEEVRGVGNDSLLLSFVDLALTCTQDNGDERPEMIDVAKQLQQIEKSIRNRLPNTSS